MKQEATQELLGRQGHHSFLIAMGVVLPAESDLVVLEGDEAMVGDGHAMGVAAEIAEHVVGTAKRRFGIDDPVLTEQGAQKSAEGWLIFQGLERAGEGELALLKASFETSDEFAAKDPTEYRDGQEERIAGMDPAGMVRGKTPGRNHTVDMRMKKEVLSPTMQHGEEAGLGAQMFGVGGDLEQGLSAGMEQEVIKDLLVH